MRNEKRSSNRKDIEKLAFDLDRFAEEYDPYEYSDCVDNPMDNVLQTLRMIQSGDAGQITDWLQQIIDDSEEGTDDVETAKMLLRTIAEWTT